MADKAKTATTPNMGKAPKSQSKMLGKLRTIVRLCGEIEKEEEDLKTYEELLDDNRRLQDQLKAKAGEITKRDNMIAGLREEKAAIIARYSDEKKTLFNNFAEQAVQWKQNTELARQYRAQVQDLSAKNSEAESQVTRLRKQLADANREHGESRKAYEAFKAEASTLRNDLQTKDLKLQVAERDLEESQEERNSLLAEIGITQLDLTELYYPLVTLAGSRIALTAHRRETLAAFAADCHALVKRFFGSATNENLVCSTHY